MPATRSASASHLQAPAPCSRWKGSAPNPGPGKGDGRIAGEEVGEAVNASYDPEKHRRRSIRLRHHDYSRAGAYYITVCTEGRKLLFGEVIDDEVKLNELGRIAAEEWSKSAQVRSEIELDTWVVMPNHVHGIVMTTDRGRGDRPVAPASAWSDDARGPQSGDA